MLQSEQHTGLYLVVETGDTKLAYQGIETALDTVGCAALLLTPPVVIPSDPATLTSMVRFVQSRGVAALIADDVALAIATKADGVHFNGSPDIVDRYTEARRNLGPRMIIGADAGPLRDDAMRLGEAGAEYVAFGLAGAEDGDDAHAQRLERTSWWAEIFEVPCVAFDVTHPEEAGDLSRAGADFVAFNLAVALSPSSLHRTLRALEDSLRAPHALRSAG